METRKLVFVINTSHMASKLPQYKSVSLEREDIWVIENEFLKEETFYNTSDS